MPENLKSEKKVGAVKKLIEIWCNTTTYLCSSQKAI